MVSPDSAFVVCVFIRAKGAAVYGNERIVDGIDCGSNPAGGLPDTKGCHRIGGYKSDDDMFLLCCRDDAGNYDKGNVGSLFVQLGVVDFEESKHKIGNSVYPVSVFGSVVYVIVEYKENTANLIY